MTHIFSVSKVVLLYVIESPFVKSLQILVDHFSGDAVIKINFIPQCNIICIAKRNHFSTERVWKLRDVGIKSEMRPFTTLRDT